MQFFKAINYCVFVFSIAEPQILKMYDHVKLMNIPIKYAFWFPGNFIKLFHTFVINYTTPQWREKLQC